MSVEQQQLHAAREIVNLINVAVSRMNKRDCGDDIVQARDIMTRNGLSLAKAFDLSIYGLNGRSEIKVEAPVVKQEEEKAQPVEEHQEETKPAEFSHPADYWVIPWAERLERILIDYPGLADKDRRAILRVQRTDKARDENDITWLRDIVHGYKRIAPNDLKVPDEYWPYKASLVNNRTTS